MDRKLKTERSGAKTRNVCNQLEPKGNPSKEVIDVLNLRSCNLISCSRQSETLKNLPPPCMEKVNWRKVSPQPTGGNGRGKWRRKELPEPLEYITPLYEALHFFAVVLPFFDDDDDVDEERSFQSRNQLPQTRCIPGDIWGNVL